MANIFTIVVDTTIGIIIQMIFMWVINKVSIRLQKIVRE
jgi:hypothetical protein